MFVNKLFTYLTCAYLKVKDVQMCNLRHIFFSFQMKTDILLDFQICISAPLTFWSFKLGFHCELT